MPRAPIQGNKKAARTIILLIDYKLPETRSAIARNDRRQLSPAEIPILWQRFPKRISPVLYTRSNRARAQRTRAFPRAAPKRRHGIDCSIKIDVDKIARGNGLFIVAQIRHRYRGLFIAVSSPRFYRDVIEMPFAKITTQYRYLNGT